MSIFLSINKILNFLTANWILFSESQHEICIWVGKLALNILKSEGHVGELKNLMYLLLVYDKI